MSTSYAICSIDSGDGKITGKAMFWQKAGRKCDIYVEVNGLTAGKHGIHIHEFGNLSDGCNTAGAHYNPYNLTHGGPGSNMRHVGDLGNLNSNGETTPAILNTTDYLVSIEGLTSIVGRAVVIHALEDDLGLGGDSGSLSTGNAGPRVACGVIGTCAPFAPPTAPSTLLLQDYP